MRVYKPKVKAPDPELISFTDKILKENAITTVCQESACPNRAECYARGTATFMILGDTCTRACKFCNVKTGRGANVDLSEPLRVAQAVKDLGLRYVVITSVDRDDLADYGSKQFVNVLQKIKELVSDIKIELLTPDFKANKEALDRVIDSNPYKLAHNQETVKRLSPILRPQSSYERSLDVLSYYSSNFKGIVKSSLMVGLGESESELLDTMRDLYSVGVTQLTIGQYLQPSKKHFHVAQYFPQEYFKNLELKAYEIGFKSVVSGILVRSSYYADSY